MFRNRSFKAILEPGVHWIFDPPKRTDVQVYDLTVPEFEHPRVDFLVKDAPATMEKHFDIVELSDSEVGLVYKNGKLAWISRRASASSTGGARSTCASRSSTSRRSSSCPRARDQAARAREAAARLAGRRSDQRGGSTGHRGRLADRGRRVREGAEPGLHVFWKFQRTLKTELVDRACRPWKSRVRTS